MTRNPILPPAPWTFSPQEEKWFTRNDRTRRLPKSLPPPAESPALGDTLADAWFR